MGWSHLRILSIGCALIFGALPAEAQDIGTLDGTWEGTLTVVTVPTTVGPARPYTVRIVMDGTNARVFGHDTTGGPFVAGPFQEIKPGRFHVARLGPNAIVASMDSGRDAEGTWVETWSFVVTLKQRDTLITNLYRVVNNVDLPLSVDHSKFTEAEAGELVRIK